MNSDLRKQISYRSMLNELCDLAPIADEQATYRMTIGFYSYRKAIPDSDILYGKSGRKNTLNTHNRHTVNNK